MDNFILELPDFLSPQLCEMIINRFNCDDTQKEGTYIYNLNQQSTNNILLTTYKTNHSS